MDPDGGLDPSRTGVSGQIGSGNSRKDRSNQICDSDEASRGMLFPIWCGRPASQQFEAEIGGFFLWPGCRIELESVFLGLQARQERCQHLASETQRIDLVVVFRGREAWPSG